MMTAAVARVARLVTLNPDAAELGRRLSLAARIDVDLVRQARLLPPRLAASAESDLWFSDLVEAQTPLGFSLDPDAAEQLRSELAYRPQMLESAWGLVYGAHREQPLSIRMEEMVNRLSLSGAQEDIERIEELLYAAAQEMVKAGSANRGWARWMVKAIARLPIAVRDNEQSRVLEQGASARLHGGLKHDGELADGEALQDWLSWLLADGVGTSMIGLRLLAGRVELGELGSDREHAIAVPATDPLVLDLSWYDGVRAQHQRVRLGKGERRIVPVSATQIEIATLSGTRWRLSEAGDAGAPVSGIDFSAVRAAHRPFLARKELVNNLLRKLALPAVENGDLDPRFQVFLSYSRADREQVDPLKRVLDKLFHGRFELWDDSRLQSGADFGPEIEAAMEASFCVIVVLTRDSLASKYVVREWRSAIKAGKRVIPLIMQEVDLPEEMVDIMTVDLTRWDGDPSFVGIERLIEGIEQAWMASLSPGTLLQITGKTGTGKTALLCRLLDLLEDGGRPCVHYFAGNGPMAWRTEQAMAESLSFQLQRQFPLLTISEDSNLGELSELIVATAGQLQNGLNVFVDALGLIPGMHALVTSLQRTQSRLPNGINFVVTATSGASLEYAIGDRANYLRVDLDQEQESNAELLQSYLDHHAEGIGDLLPPGRMSVKLLVDPGGEQNLLDDLRERLWANGFAVFESDEDDWAAKTDFARGNGIVIVILNASLLQDRARQLRDVLEGVQEWIAVHTDDSPASKVALEKLLAAGTPQPASLLAIADEPDPDGRIVGAVQDRVQASPLFESVREYLFGLANGNIGRLKPILEWIQSQPPGPIDSARIPPVLYQGMEAVWEKTVDGRNGTLAGELAITLTAARQPLSLQWLLEPGVRTTIVAEAKAGINLRSAPDIQADVVSQLAGGSPVRILSRRHHWTLLEYRLAGEPIVAGWASDNYLLPDASSTLLDASSTLPDVSSTPEDGVRLSAARRLMAELLEKGLVLQSAAPIDGRHPTGSSEVQYALSDPAIGAFIAQTLPDYELQERHRELATLHASDSWEAGPVQGLAWRYAVAHSLRHYILSGEFERAVELTFDPGYLAVRIQHQGIDELDADLKLLMEQLSDVRATDA